MKKPLFAIMALVLALGLALPMGMPTAVATAPPHLEVGKIAGPDPISIDEEGTVTLTLTGAGSAIVERGSLDVILIIDLSGSMAWDNPTRLSQAQDAAKVFIDMLDSTRDRVGLVSFANSATLNIGLTDDFASVKSAIDTLSAHGPTNIGDAIYTANDEFDVHGSTDAIWVEILLTDGLPNKPYGPGDGFWEPDAAYARTAAQAAQEADVPITLYTIGLGADISYYFLDDNPASGHTYNPGDPAGDPYDYDGLAYIGGGKYYHAPTGDDLQAIFEALAYELITIAGQNVVVTEVLPDGVHYVPGSIVPEPDEISPDGQTLIWNLGTISIDETITMTFHVTFDEPGHQLVDDLATNVTYTDYQGVTQTEYFPETWVNVSAGEIASLDLTPDGGSATAGVAFDVTVTAKDSHGGVDTGYTGTVTFTSSDSGASLPPDYAFQLSDNGVKTFSGGVTLVTAGSQDVTVTDTEDSLLTDTETWDVSAGLAASLELEPPEASNPVNTDHTLTATVYDQFDNPVPDQTVSWSIESGPGDFVGTPETTTDANGQAEAVITSTEVGTTTVEASVPETIYDTATKTWTARHLGGGSGGGIDIMYFTVDFQGEITREPMSSRGRLLNALEAPSPDGMHLLEMAKGTKTVDDKGNIVKRIEIREAEAPLLAADTVIVGNAYDFEPSNITFDQPIRITLGYDNLPEDVASIALAYYTATTGWTELKPEGGVVAGEGKLTAPVDHFTIFAILAELNPPPPPPPPSSPPPAPAAFKVDNLQITPSQFRIWEPVTFVVKTGEEVAISAYVTNYGGQEGKYTAILKVNGATQATEEIILGSGQGQQISFTLTENEPGLYTVDIGGLSGEFVTSLWTNWWLMGGILAALILIGWLAWYYGYYRRRQ